MPVLAGIVTEDMKKILVKEPLENEISAIVIFEYEGDISEYVKIQNKYKIIPAASVRMRAGNVQKLANLPFVKQIEPDYVVEAVLDFSIPQIRANEVWKNSTGKGIDIAIVDTGIKKRTELNVVK